MYWMEEEETICGLCERGPGTLIHLIEDCTDTERLFGIQYRKGIRGDSK